MKKSFSVHLNTSSLSFCVQGINFFWWLFKAVTLWNGFSRSIHPFILVIILVDNSRIQQSLSEWRNKNKFIYLKLQEIRRKNGKKSWQVNTPFPCGMIDFTFMLRVDSKLWQQQKKTINRRISYLDESNQLKKIKCFTCFFMSTEIFLQSLNRSTFIEISWQIKNRSKRGKTHTCFNASVFKKLHWMCLVASACT